MHCILVRKKSMRCKGWLNLGKNVGWNKEQRMVSPMMGKNTEGNRIGVIKADIK